MGLTKQYLRYVPAGNFNIIASPNCNLCFVALGGQEGRFVAAGACEHIVIWDLRLGEKAQILSGEKSPVTYISASPNKRNIASGYTDGNVQIYDLKTGEVVTIFSGHRSEVTCLCYDSFGHKLASGSKDTDIIVWDTVAETGICRLNGHKGPITQLAFMANQPYLISSAKDTFVKYWDLDTQHCFKTLVAHRTEVWSVCLMKDDRYLVSASGDAELRVWKLKDRNNTDLEDITSGLQLASLEDTEEDSSYTLQCFKAGSLLRSGRGRVISMYSDITGQVVGCHGSDAQIELFLFLSDDDAKSRMKKRLKKERKKNESAPATDDSTPQEQTITLRDEVKRLSAIKLSSKPKSLHLVLGNGGELRVTVVLAKNTIELYSVQTEGKDVEPRCLREVTMHGHQGEVRAVNFSSDSLAVVSGSSESIKMWNRPTQISLRTVETGYVLCTMFVPGDRHVLAGLKDGRLLILDIAAGDVLEEIPAHSNELWTMCLQPDMKGIVTGGGDKTVKFWQFELIAEEATHAKVLSLVHTRTLKLEESVLCVRLSPNKKFIAVALLDSTVKMFFMDTFKFYLSLYGHKLPVLCMDISSDSTLIATGSADRNVKIWGMDFGDCHKSIFAHDDSVTGLQFVLRTHYFFTCGKDGKVKQWDADTYDKVITLQGHVGEAWCLAVSPNGQFVVSCGADRVLRLYEKTDQPLVLQDEEEEEREAQEGLATGEQSMIPGQPGKVLPSKKTIGSERAAESILECLDVCEKYKEVLAEHAALQAGTEQTLPPPAVPLIMQAFGAITIDDFVLETLKRIRPSDMEEALLIVPFTSVCDMMKYLPALIARGDYIELVLKVVMFLLKTHHAPIVANHSLLSTIQNIQQLAIQKTEELRDTIGYNYYGMQFIQREVEALEGVRLFRDATVARKRGEKKRKQRERIKRSIIMVSN